MIAEAHVNLPVTRDADVAPDGPAGAIERAIRQIAMVRELYGRRGFRHDERRGSSVGTRLVVPAA